MKTKYFVPFWNFSCPFASFANIVKDLTQFTAAPARCDPINAYVEVLTVVRVGIARVRQPHSLVYLRTIELEHLCN